MLVLFTMSLCILLVCIACIYYVCARRGLNTLEQLKLKTHDPDRAAVQQRVNRSSNVRAVMYPLVSEDAFYSTDRVCCNTVALSALISLIGSCEICQLPEQCISQALSREQRRNVTVYVTDKYVGSNVFLNHD